MYPVTKIWRAMLRQGHARQLTIDKNLSRFIKKIINDIKRGLTLSLYTYSLIQQFLQSPLVEPLGVALPPKDLISQIQIYLDLLSKEAH